MQILCVIYDDYSVVFWFSVFWFRQQMLCGISNIFSRQTIRDLSKKSSALWSSYVLWNPKYSIITHFMENETYSPHLSWLFDNFSILVFWKMQLPQNRIFSCVLDIFIPFIMAIWSFSISCVLEKFKFFKIEHFRANEWDSCRFRGYFRSFHAFQCLGTSERCSAGSQIFFLNKQSENCQTNACLFNDHLCGDVWKIPLS